MICHIAEPEEMPVDGNGVRADIIMDPGSIPARMNPGVPYEQYFNAASYDVVLKIVSALNVSKSDKLLPTKLLAMEKTDPDTINKVWDYLLGYYKIISPKMYEWFTCGVYPNPRTVHLASIVNKGIFIHYPPNNEPEAEDIISEIETHYKPLYGPVTYIGNSGRRVTTKANVRIGSSYMILLEKTGDDWTAVSSSKVQHYGVLAQITNADKYAQPSRQNAIRALGESEVRIYNSYVGTRVTADIIDRNNNPKTHKQIVESILQAAQPTNIQTSVNRAVIPLGGSKPVQLVKHLVEVSGLRFIYREHVPSYANSYKQKQ